MQSSVTFLSQFGRFHLDKVLNFSEMLGSVGIFVILLIHKADKHWIIIFKYIQAPTYHFQWMVNSQGYLHNFSKTFPWLLTKILKSLILTEWSIYLHMVSWYQSGQFQYFFFYPYILFWLKFDFFFFFNLRVLKTPYTHLFWPDFS